MQKLRSNPNKLFKAAAAAALILLTIAVSLTAYPLPARAQASTDATLSALTVSPKDIIGFDADRTSYQVGVASAVTEATVTPTVNHPGAGVSFDTPDSNDVTDGHQVALSAGRNTVTITVTAENGSDEQDYTVSVNQGVSGDYGWKAEKDLDGLAFEGPLASSDIPTGIAENNGIFWISSALDVKILAYRQDGNRLPSRDISRAAENARTYYLWTDGQTLWTSDSLGDRLYAYRLSDGNRQSDREFDLHIENDEPRGIWSDGYTVWVADNTDDKLYAYQLSDGSRQESREFDLDSSNDHPQGIWSDGYTVWVADNTDDKLYAYGLQGGQRQGGRDFNTLSGAGNTTNVDITSDGRTMWAVDSEDDKVFSYNMPPSANANLSSLTVNPKDIIGFAPDRTSYEVGVAGSVGTATVTAAADHPAATIGYSATDAEPGTPGHQVSLSAGRNAVTVTITAEDSSTKEYTVSINRGVNSQYGWKAGDDLDGLIAADNRGPRGIWANSTTFYVSDFTDNKVYAYNRDGTRDESKDFDVSNFANGIWSDGANLWVADSAVANLNAYTLSNGNRNSSADIALSNSSRGVWGNATTVWAVNETTDKLEAYQKSDGSEDNDRDISLHSDNGDPAGIWSDDTTIWVADHQQVKLFAYTLADGNRDSTKDIDTSPSGNGNPRGIWGDEETIWVTSEDDDKVYSYNLQDNRSADATLSDLTVSPRDIIGFESGRGAYEVGVASTVAQATVIATTNHPSASVTYSGTDADLNTDGHQVTLSAGRNAVTITVTAEDTTTVKTYTVSINKGVTADYGWKADDDLDGLIAAENTDPRGVWSNGTTIWVSDSVDNKIYAYRISDKARDPNEDFDTLDAASNHQPSGIWSDGMTMWVSDTNDDKIYAYNLTTKAHDASKDFDTLRAESNVSPTGIWSDGTTMWVADEFESKLYAYQMSNKERDSGKEFNNLSLPTFGLPKGIWSDGHTMWVADSFNERIYAYRMSDKVSDSGRRFNTLDAAGNDDSFGIWSDGQTMLVADFVDDKVYSYNMPPSNDATLSALTVSPKNINGFTSSRTSYEVGVASTVAEATVTATPEHPGAEAVITPGDSNDEVVGHQATLSAGRNAVTITVTAEDTTTVRTYTVNINRGVDTDYGWKASEDMEILGIVSNNRPADMWSNGETIWIVDADDDKIYAYRMSDKTRDSDKDFNTLSAAGNANPRGMWSDGITMWVSDNADDKIYAYRMSDKLRDDGKDFNSIISQNGALLSLWSDGVTMWVSDERDERIYAYRMSDKQYDSGKDFTGLAPAGNGTGTGIWSDGVTMWVADFTDNKVYAYWMGSKNRNSSRDFNNLGSHGNEELWGIWSDGDTMWVVSQEADKVYSYNMPASNDADLSATTLAQGSGTPAEIAAFDRYTSGYTVNVPNDIEQVTVAGTKSHAQATGPVISPADADPVGDGHQVGLAVGDTAITFVVTAEDGSTNTYTVTVTRLPQVSTDATLSALTVSPRNIIGFDADRTSYEVGVASSVSQATVTAAANHAAASLAYSGTDADLNTAGHQVDLSAGRNQVTVTVTAEDSSTQAYTLSINRGITDDYGWKAGDDLDGLIASDLFTPTGIASDGSRFWITTENDIPIFAFNYLGQPEAARNIAPASDNGNPTYLWADATTLFVVDPVDLRVYAYQLSDGARQNSREFPLVNTNSNPTGIWSNGVTAWIADSADHQLYAYNLAGRTPDADKNIDLDGDNTDPAGVASNGATIWVADPTDQKVYAYALQGGVRVVTKELNTLVNAGNTAPSGMWANQETIWINDAADSKTYTYNLPPARAPQQVAADATLSALTVSPKDIVRFNPDDAFYEVGVASTVTEATVAATTNAPNAMAFITPTDANDVTDGHQVDLSAGRNPVTIRVTSQDGSIRTYRVSINRGVTANFGWKADEDLDGLPHLTGGSAYKGIAENNGIFWITTFYSRTLAAYQQDGLRLPARDIDLHSDNLRASYLWTNGQTIWVSDPTGEKLFAYRLSDGNRLDSSDIAPHVDNDIPVGIWSDGTTIWVLDRTQTRLYAYALDGGARQESREFDLHSSNADPTGIWSDGYTMWVGDTSDDKLYAYFLETGQRRGRLDFNTLSAAGNQKILGITSNGTTMWVLDAIDKKVYSYNLLLSDDSTLSALTVRPKDIIGFDAERDSYQLGVASTVTLATATATANHPGARVTFTPPDASSGTRGHQVDLSAGRNPVTITVTAEGGTTQDYTISINRGVADDYGWKAGDDLDGLIAAGNRTAAGIWSNGTTTWVADSGDDKIYAYNPDGTRDSAKDFDTLAAAENTNAAGIWSDGTTMWVGDFFDNKLYAYRMSNQERDDTKDFDSLGAAGNTAPTSIWSDGTTMWVSDSSNFKLYAYRMSDQERDDTKDFDSLSAAGNSTPNGIWSDGATMWVADWFAGKLFAYRMSDQEPNSNRDFDTLSTAGNNAPTGMWSDGATMWVTDEEDDKVYSYNMPLLPPANVQAAIGDRRIAITWDDPQRSAITGYQYRVSSNDGDSWDPDWTTMPGSNARTTTFTVRNLANNFEHVIEIRALEGAKTSEAARTRATPMGPPSVPLMPENLDTAAGDQTLYLSWHKPVEDPRAPVTSFDARYRPYGSSRSWRNATSVSVEQTARTLYDQTIGGLDNRRTHEVQVAAVNSVGRGEWATATGVPQAQYRRGPLSDDGDADLDLGTLGAYWTDSLDSYTFHPDTRNLNINVIENSCLDRTAFRVFWDVQDKAAEEYEADIQTRGGAGEFTHRFGAETVRVGNTAKEQGFISGTAELHKYSTLQMRVRARFDPEGWSTWTEPVNLYCYTPESPSASQQPASSAQQAEADNNPATGRPAIAGAAEVGETLTASTGAIADPDGLTSAAFSYQWSRGDGSTKTDISGATASTYTLQNDDLDHQVSVTVAFTDDEGNDETLTSAAVLVLAATPSAGPSTARLCPASTTVPTPSPSKSISVRNRSWASRTCGTTFWT